jgi:hypothetical protein
MQSIENKIGKSILSKPRGYLLLPGDFTSFGSSDAVRKALDRLQDKEIIKRLSIVDEFKGIIEQKIKPRR